MDMNSILIALSSSGQTDFGREDFANQSTPQKVFSAVWALESEVNNGGFSQYFSNSSAETAPFVAEALETIQATKAAEICRRAIATAFPAGLPSRPEDIQSAAEDFSADITEHLSTIDEEFFSYPDDLTRLLFIYVRNHPEAFGEISRATDE